MSILTDQFKKISTFIYILIFLFIFNIVFNLNYKWDGISIIVRVYLFVFSFYLIFHYASVDIHPLLDEYRLKYGKIGKYIVFFKTRITPFLVIYLVTIIFTLIDYLGTTNWPIKSILDLLNGRNSNIVIYSLLLLLILKIKMDPKITVPLFLLLGALYFVIYKIVYSYSPGGVWTSALKLFNFIIVFFFLPYEYFNDSKRIIKSTVISLLASVIMYFSVVSIFYFTYRMAPFGSYAQIQSGFILLRMGYSFPLSGIMSIITKSSGLYSGKDLVYNLIKYKKDIRLSNTKWEMLLFSGSVMNADIISGYLLDKNIEVSFRKVISFVETKSIDSGEALLEANNFIKYVSKFYGKNCSDFDLRLQNRNLRYKLWALKVIEETKCIKSIPLLVEMLSDIDNNISISAYSVLKNITGKDYAKVHRAHINSPEVIKDYRRYYLHLHKDY